jgi:hypothetical protein
MGFTLERVDEEVQAGPPGLELMGREVDQQ